MEDKEENENFNFNNINQLTLYVNKKEKISHTNDNSIKNNLDENVNEEINNNKNINQSNNNEGMQIDEEENKAHFNDTKQKEKDNEEVKALNILINYLEGKLKENNNIIEQERKEKEEMKNNYNNLKIEYNKLKVVIKDIEEYKKEIQKLNLELKEKDSEIEKIRNNFTKAIKDKSEKEKNYNELKNKFEQYKISINNEILLLKNKNERSKCKTIHENIKCQRCFQEPIIGFRYKCSKCNNYNLCQNCEEDNSINNDHPHLFLKIKNELLENTTILNEVKIKYSNEYSYKCLTKQLKVYIYQGVKETIIPISLKNDGLIKWPENKTKLIQEKNMSNIFCNEINLKGQNPKDQSNYDIQLKNLNNLIPGIYPVYLNFNVNGNNYGDKICLSVIVNEKNNNENNNKYETIEKFKQKYNFRHEEFSDEMIFNKLIENNYDFESTFFRLYFC